MDNYPVNLHLWDVGGNRALGIFMPLNGEFANSTDSKGGQF